MFPSHEREIGTIAFHLLASLEVYEQEMHQLVQHGWDAQLYASSTARFDEMRHLAGAIPAVSPAWVELLIRRFELTAAIWDVVGHKRSGHCEELLGMQQRHDDAMRALKGRIHAHIPKA